MEGWIKLHRTLQKWGWKRSPYHMAVFIDLLLEANHKDNECLGVKIPKGSLTTSIKAISQRSGVTDKRVRTILTHLKQTNEVAITTTPKFTMISIIKWDEYQLTGEENGEQRANGGQTAGKRRATNKNAKNVKNEKNSPTILETEPPLLAEETHVDELALRVLTAFNSICFSDHRPNKKNMGHINARIKEGYSLEEFVLTIKHRQAEWANNPKMAEYIRPRTIFSTNFDDYLQAAKNADKPIVDPLEAWFREQGHEPERLIS